MNKRVLAVLLAALMLFALTACSASSTSTTTTTITTSKTDENGNTTTNTVTNEIGISAGTDGISTTNQTTTDTKTESSNTGVTSDELAGALAQKFSAGAEGVTADGDKVLFAYDDPETFSYGAIILIMDGGKSLMGREGEIRYEEEQWVLVDEEMDARIPFVLSETEDNDETRFVMTFQDGDSAVMTAVDAKTIIDDMIAALNAFNA